MLRTFQYKAFLGHCELVWFFFFNLSDLCCVLLDFLQQKGFFFSSWFSEEIKAKEDGGERIRLLQDKINEMRKVYSSLKAEVASIDRKRKRLKKKRGRPLCYINLFYSSFDVISSDFPLTTPVLDEKFM